jgi:poly(ADP-ribose) glycohydrolase ARH3
MNKPVESGLLLHKFEGAMLGSALGDAFGEHRRITSISVLDNRLKILRHTDDTVMAIALAESIIACDGRIEERSLGDRFRVSFFKEPWRGYAGGPPTIFSKMQTTGRRDYYAAAKEIGERLFPGDSWGNGAAMRVAPLVLFYDSEDLYDKVEAQARITHTHPIAIDGAAVLTKAISEAVKLYPPRTFDQVYQDASFDALAFCDTLIAFSRNDVIRDKMIQVKKCIQTDISDADAAHLLGQSVAAHESVPFAIYSFLRNHDSFLDCLYCATGNGGDTDTLGAMACAISGAYLGIDGLPHMIGALEIGPYPMELAVYLWFIHQGLRRDIAEKRAEWEQEGALDTDSLAKLYRPPELIDIPISYEIPADIDRPPIEELPGVD